MLRVNVDAGTIEKLDCDGNWIQWFPPSGGTDPDLGAAMRQAINDRVAQIFGGVPDDRSTTPGQCIEYDLILFGDNQVVLPIHIDEGDLITVTNTRGRVTENPGVLDFVYNYFQPVGSGATQETDPAPTVDHMRLIMNISGTWFDAYNVTDFSVPSGIVQDNLVFQVNDYPIDDNKGQYAFHVKICKGEIVAPTEGNWIKIYDFRTGSKWGWGTDENTASWTGTGWLFDALDDVIDAPNLTDTDTVVERMETFWTNGNAENTVFFYTGDTIVTAAQNPYTDLVAPTPVDSNRIAILTEWGAGHHAATLYKVIVHGYNTPMPNGVNPF